MAGRLVLTELGDHEDTHTGTPQGGILSPLLANIAPPVLDEYVHAPWEPGGLMSTRMRRKRRGWKGLPNWRLVRYADDFVVLVWGDRHHVRVRSIEHPCDVLEAKQIVVDMEHPRGKRRWVRTRTTEPRTAVPLILPSLCRQPPRTGRTTANCHECVFAGGGHARISANPAELGFNRLVSERSSVQS